jgi:hypothetical protein
MLGLGLTLLNGIKKVAELTANLIWNLKQDYWNNEQDTWN